MKYHWYVVFALSILGSSTFDAIVCESETPAPTIDDLERWKAQYADQKPNQWATANLLSWNPVTVTVIN